MRIGRARTFRGEVWTDGRGRATIVVPAEMDLLEASVRYRLDASPDNVARVVAASRDGRVSIETDEPHVKVAWRLTAWRPVRGRRREHR